MSNVKQQHHGHVTSDDGSWNRLWVPLLKERLLENSIRRARKTGGLPSASNRHDKSRHSMVMPNMKTNRQEIKEKKITSTSEITKNPWGHENLPKVSRCVFACLDDPLGLEIKLVQKFHGGCIFQHFRNLDSRRY